MMNAVSPTDHLPEKVSPLRQDAPGAVTSMPSPTKLHHIHIFDDDRYDELVKYCKLLLNAEVVKVAPGDLTFLSFDDHADRMADIRTGARRRAYSRRSNGASVKRMWRAGQS